MAEKINYEEWSSEITDDELNDAFAALIKKSKEAQAQPAMSRAADTAKPRVRAKGIVTKPVISAPVKTVPFEATPMTVDDQTALIDSQAAMNRSMTEWQNLLAPECGVYNTKYGFLVKEYDSVIYEYIGRDDKEAANRAKHNLVALLRYKYFKNLDDAAQEQIDKIVTWFTKNIYNNICYMTIDGKDTVRNSMSLETLPPYCVAFANGVYDFKNNKFLLKYERIRIPAITNTMILYPKYCIMWCFNYDFEPLPIDINTVPFASFCDGLRGLAPDKSNLAWQLFSNMTHDAAHVSTERRRLHLAEILGYITMTPFVQSFVVLIGSGQNGKNSLLDGACTHYLLPAAGQESIDSIEEDKFIGGTLRGLSHNICLETEPGVKKTSDQLKKLTGSNEYAIEEKGKTKTTIPMNCKFVFSANNRENIKFSDQTQGFLRRCNLYELYYKWDHDHNFMKYNPDYYACDLMPQDLMQNSNNNRIFVYLAMYGIKSATKNFTQGFNFTYNDWSSAYVDSNDELESFFETEFTPETLFRFWGDVSLQITNKMQDFAFYIQESTALSGWSKLANCDLVRQTYGKLTWSDLAPKLRQYETITDYDQDGNEMQIREMNGVHLFEQTDLFISLEYLRAIVKLLKPQILQEGRMFSDDFRKTMRVVTPRIANNKAYARARLINGKVRFINEA